MTTLASGPAVCSRGYDALLCPIVDKAARRSFRHAVDVLPEAVEKLDAGPPGVISGTPAAAWRSPFPDPSGNQPETQLRHRFAACRGVYGPGFTFPHYTPTQSATFALPCFA